MKYIKLFENFSKNKAFVKYGLDQYKIKKYTINDDLTVDIEGSVDLSYSGFEKLPFKFGKVTGSFIIRSCNIETLEGCPYEVGGNFDCSNNNLDSLKGSPSLVDGDFECRKNGLTSLEGMPLEIGGDLICYNNRKLRSLDSISNIEGTIFCDDSIDTSKFQGYCKEIKKF